MARTPFVETESLLSVMEGDHGSAQDTLSGMLPGELETLEGNCLLLAGLARQEFDQRKREGEER